MIVGPWAAVASERLWMTSFAFQSDTGFMKAAAPNPRTPFALAGVAWDGSTTNRPGARMAPRAIRQASHML